MPELTQLAAQNLHDLSAIDDLQVRVANYQKGTWQAIVKRRDKTLPWGVAIAGSAEEALTAALAQIAHPVRPKVTPRVRTRTRT